MKINPGVWADFYLEKEGLGWIFGLGVIRPEGAGVGLHLQQDVHSVIVIGLPGRGQDGAGHFREFWELVLVGVVLGVRVDVFQEFNSYQKVISVKGYRTSCHVTVICCVEQ